MKFLQTVGRGPGTSQLDFGDDSITPSAILAHFHPAVPKHWCKDCSLENIVSMGYDRASNGRKANHIASNKNA